MQENNKEYNKDTYPLARGPKPMKICNPPCPVCVDVKKPTPSWSETSELENLAAAHPARKRRRASSMTHFQGVNDKLLGIHAKSWIR